MNNDAASGLATHRVSAGVVIYARDMARLAVFYAGLAGLVEVQRDHDFTVLERGAFQLVVVAMPSPIASRIVLSEPPRRRTETPIKPVFVVGDFDDLRDVVVRRGGVLDPQGKAWQFGCWRVLDGHDPEGNVFQLREFIHPDE
jgi:predicted enzyme related to lactoylglutathione lyase